MSLITLTAVVIFSAGLTTLALVLFGSRKMQNLADIQPERTTRPLPVSIIVPACNEARQLQPALRSLLSQDYPNLEIIAIDDRSSDNTWEILQQIATESPRLRLLQIDELPPGWLGKNHALYRGAQLARGEIFLFTDADVNMAPSTVSRAVAYLVRQQADHLSLVFRNITQGALLNAMVVDALGGLFLLLRPWNVRRKSSRAFMGVGAFNMITAAAYYRLGGHAALKMHPIDDVMLGKKVKTAGMRQECLLGGDFVTVRWYASIREMVNGLMKNIFALYSYRVGHAAVAVAGITIMTIVPFWGLLFTRGTAQLFFGLALVSRLTVFSLNARLMKVGPATVPASLLTPYLIIWIIIRAVTLTIKNQGIDWRGTHYDLRELKQQEQLFTFFK